MIENQLYYDSARYKFRCVAAIQVTRWHFRGDYDSKFAATVEKFVMGGVFAKLRHCTFIYFHCIMQILLLNVIEKC